MDQLVRAAFSSLATRQREKKTSSASEAFLARYWADRDSGGVRSLREYLESFQDAELDIAARFLALQHPTGVTPPDTSDYGSYRVVREIGRGGQATVFEAQDLRLHRTVALKVIFGSGGLSDPARRRFEREAQVIARLDHEGVCPIFGAGVQDGDPYIAMALVEGETLAKKIARRRAEVAEEPDGDQKAPAATSGGSEIPSTVALFVKVARALHAVHESGVVHRDLKPSNLMVTSEERPVLLDFGLAQDTCADASLTLTGERFGTPAYMAPEQVAGGAVDRRADVYGLGVSLFEVLTLRRPFSAATRQELDRMARTRPAPDVRRLNPSVPKDLARVVATCLEKDKRLRYQTAEAVAEDLQAVADGRPLAAGAFRAHHRFGSWARREPLKATLLFVVLTTAALLGFLVARWPDFARGAQERRAQELESFLTEGYAELGEGSAKRAQGVFAPALAVDEDALDALAGLTLAHLEAGRPEEAGNVLSTHRHRLGSLRHRLRVEVLRALRKEQEAAALQGTLPTPTSAAEFFLAGNAEMLAGHKGDQEAFARAFGLFTEAVVRAPRARALYLIQRAHAAGHLKDVAVARGAAEVAHHLFPDSQQAIFFRAFALRDSDPEGSARILRDLLRDDPDHLMARENLAAALEVLSRYDDELLELQRLLKLNPNLARLHFKLGNVWSRNPRTHQEAMDAYRRCLELNPGHVQARISLGRMLLDVFALDESEAQFKKLMQLGNVGPNLWEAHRGLSSIALYRGELELSLDHAQKALALQPDSALPHFCLGNTYLAMGKNEEAVDSFREAVGLDPEHFDSHLNLGNVLFMMNRRVEGMRALKRAVALVDELRESGQSEVPNARRARYNLGYQLFARQDFDAARDQFQRILQGTPELPLALLSKGVLRLLEGRFQDAESLLKDGLNRATGPWEEWSPALRGFLEDAERLMAGDDLRVQYLNGRAIATTKARLEMSKACLLQKRYELAATVWKEFFQSWPTGKSVARYTGASAAVAAGTRTGRSELSAEAKAHWRREALRWLQAALADWTQIVEDERMPPRRVRAFLERWLLDGYLAQVREPEGMARLPRGEQKEWNALWSAVNELLQGLE